MPQNVIWPILTVSPIFLFDVVLVSVSFMFSIRSALQRQSVPVAKSVAAIAGAGGAAAFFNHSSLVKMAETSDAGNAAFSPKVWRLGWSGLTLLLLCAVAAESSSASAGCAVGRKWYRQS